MAIYPMEKVENSRIRRDRRSEVDVGGRTDPQARRNRSRQEPLAFFRGYYLPLDLNFERTTSRFLITSFLGFFFSVKSRGSFNRKIRDQEAHSGFK